LRLSNVIVSLIYVNDGYQRNRGSSATREEAMADFKARWLADIN
jgi:hypothetical protein